MKKNSYAGMTMLLLGVIACQPVFAIGWREVFFVIALAVFLLGPPVYRFLRKLENYRRQKDK